MALGVNEDVSFAVLKEILENNETEEDIAEAIKGKPANAESHKDENTKRGIWIYVIAAVLLAGGLASSVPVMRKNMRNRRR